MQRAVKTVELTGNDQTRDLFIKDADTQQSQDSRGLERSWTLFQSDNSKKKKKGIVI